MARAAVTRARDFRAIAAKAWPKPQRSVRSVPEAVQGNTLPIEPRHVMHAQIGLCGGNEMRLGHSPEGRPITCLVGQARYTRDGLVRGKDVCTVTTGEPNSAARRSPRDIAPKSRLIITRPDYQPPGASAPRSPATPARSGSCGARLSRSRGTSQTFPADGDRAAQSHLDAHQRPAAGRARDRSQALHAGRHPRNEAMTDRH